MHAPVSVTAGDVGKRIDIGRLDLRELTVMDHGGGQLVNLGQLLENLCIGRIAALRFLPMRKFEHLEQDMPELLGRIDVELLARKLVYLRFQLVDFNLGACTEIGKRL